MQPLRTDRLTEAGSRDSGSLSSAPMAGPSAAQAATYIYDMTSTMQSIAAQHNLSTLALILEMAAVEASSIRSRQA